jgi:hypothetical protein
MRGTLPRQTLILLAAALGAAACSTASSPFTPENPFPSRAEVASIAEAAPPEAVEIQTRGKIVDRWTLTGPLPTTIGATPHTATTPLERVAAANVGAGIMTEQLACAAREVGLFHLANGEYPAQHVERFILARCGATPSGIGASSMTWKKSSPDAVADYAKLVADTPDLGKMAADMSSNAGSQLGVWMGESDEAVVAYVVTGRARVTLEPTSILPGEDNEVVLRGEVSSGGYAISGLVTRGERGAEACSTNTAVKMPAFEISCPVDPADASARFELSMVPKPTSVMSTRVLSQMVWPARAPTMEYVSPTSIQIISGMEVSTQAGQSAFPEEFVAMANVLRADAGLDPFVHAAEQSASQQKLTPHIVAALSGDEERAEQIIMAASAGWEVSAGRIVDSHVNVAFTNTTDPRQLMGELVDTPSGRRLLFTQGAGAMSIGALGASGRSAMLLSTYQFLPETSHKERLKTAQRTINRARKLAGKGKLKRYKNFYERADRLAAKVEAGEINPQTAADILADDVMSLLNRSVRYQMILTGSLDDFIVPESLVSPAKINGAIMVTPYQPEGFPHVMYVVTVIYPDMGESASLDPSSAPSLALPAPSPRAFGSF